MIAPADNEPQNRDSLVHGEKLQLLFRQSFPPVFVSLTISGLLTSVLWQVEDHALLLAWLSVLTFSSVIRLGLFAAYRHKRPSLEDVLA